jgi:copper transport protein
MSGDPGNAGATNVRCLAIVVGSLVVLVGLAAACLGDTALAQGLHGGHSGHASPGQLELMTGIEHGCTLAATALLAGLAPFAALVWLPASREVGGGHDAIGPFGILAWMLFYVLAVSGVGELSAYAMRASGEPLGTELFREALFDTRVGAVWLARLGFGLLTAVAITAAARSGWASLWWAAAGIGSLLLMTLTQLSHAAAEGRFLPFLADWTHAMAAALWVGGLLGFVVALFSGPLGALAADRRAKLRERSVRRFSKVATAAVLVLASTGLYAMEDPSCVCRLRPERRPRPLWRSEVCGVHGGRGVGQPRRPLFTHLTRSGVSGSSGVSRASVGIVQAPRP